MSDWPNYDFPTTSEDDSAPTRRQRLLQFIDDNIPTLGIIWNSLEDLLTIALGAYLGALLSTVYANTPPFNQATPDDVWPIVLALLIVYVLTIYGMRLAAHLAHRIWIDLYNPL